MNSASVSPSEYPYLALLLGAYFHEDWAAEHAGAEGVLLAFARNEAAAVSGTRQDIARLLVAVPDDLALGSAVAALGCYYRPADGAAGYRTWLTDVRGRLGAS